MNEAELIAALEAKGLSDIKIMAVRTGIRAIYQRRDGERGAHAVDAPPAMARAAIAKWAA